jgi:hypothetical protein
LALDFVKKVEGVKNIVMTSTDVSDAHEAYGGMGKGARVPFLRERTLYYWVRGRTGARGTNYSECTFAFPN